MALFIAGVCYVNWLFTTAVAANFLIPHDGQHEQCKLAQRRVLRTK
jgi:hypothetical protein